MLYLTNMFSLLILDNYKGNNHSDMLLSIICWMQMSTNKFLDFWSQCCEIYLAPLWGIGRNRSSDHKFLSDMDMYDITASINTCQWEIVHAVHNYALVLRRVFCDPAQARLHHMVTVHKLLLSTRLDPNFKLKKTIYCKWKQYPQDGVIGQFSSEHTKVLTGVYDLCMLGYMLYFWNVGLVKFDLVS